MSIIAQSASDQVLLGNIIKLYQASFGHQPDNTGLEYWYGQAKSGVTLGHIADSFVHAAGLDNLSRDVLLVDLYAAMFGRAPDATGLAYWKASTLSYGEIVASFAVSQEFAAVVSGSVQQVAYLATQGQHIDSAAKLGGIPEYTLPHGETTTVYVPVNVLVDKPVAEAHVVSLDGDGTLTELAQKPDHTMLLGSGNAANHWGVLTDKTTNIEIALNPIYRQSPTEIAITDVHINGTHGEFTATADAGTQNGTHGGEPVNVNRSAVSINWAVSGGPGALGQDGTHQIVMDVEGADHVTHSFKLTFGAGGEHIWRDVATNTPVIVDSPVNAFTEQNSQNFAFPVLGATANVQPGDYDVTIREVSLVGLDAGQTVASLTAHLHLV